MNKNRCKIRVFITCIIKGSYFKINWIKVIERGKKTRFENNTKVNLKKMVVVSLSLSLSLYISMLDVVVEF